MGWIVRIDLPEIDRDLASSALWDVNTTGIAEVDCQSGPAGASGSYVTLLAGFDREGEARSAAAGLAALDRRRIGPHVDGASGAPWSIDVEPIDERAWTDPDQRAEVVFDTESIMLEVAGAFGHGSHPTTELMLRLLAERGASGSVLDFGTGTGVLAIAAAVAGAGDLVAIDDDPGALAVAERNWAANPNARGSCSASFHLALPLDVDDHFNVVMANVLLPVHQEHAPSLVRALRPDGEIIVAGILEEQRADVLMAYAGLGVKRTATSGDWLGLVLA